MEGTERSLLMKGHAGLATGLLEINHLGSEWMEAETIRGKISEEAISLVQIRIGQAQS